MTTEFRRVPFLEERRGNEFNEAFTKAIGAIVRSKSEELIPAENHGRFYHGLEWEIPRGDGMLSRSALQQASVGGEIAFAELMECRFAALPECVASISKRMGDAMERALFERVAEDAAAVGNTASASGKQTPEALLEMLRKIEFSVDRTGRISRPSIHVSPEGADKLRSALAAAGPSFHAEVAEIMERKDADALQRERERLNRFKVR